MNDNQLDIPASAADEAGQKWVAALNDIKDLYEKGFFPENTLTANDAISGAEVIRTLSPHILFTDIKMPNQDGLTMLAGLRSEFPNMKVTVLTGYRDFSYAQEAIRLGVTRFLLKPSKMGEIKEALEVMTQQLAEQDISGEEPCEDDAQGTAGSFLVRQAVAYIWSRTTGKS